MKRKIVFISAFTLAFIVVGVSSSTLAAQTNSSNHSTLSSRPSENNPIVQDAKSYMADYGVSMQEALRRLRLQGRIGKLDLELMSKERDTFAGLWIQHNPEYKVIARFTRDGEQTIKPYIRGGPLENLVEVWPADATLVELEAAQSGAIGIAAPLGVPAETEIDVINNRATISVTNRSRLIAALRTKKMHLPKQADVVEVDKLLELSANMFGGRNLYIPGSVDCTTGFSVRHSSGVKGTTTAAHCWDRVYVKGVRLPVVTGALKGPYDFQWHRTPGFVDRPWTRARGGNIRQITRARGRFQQPVGSVVCHYGQGGDIPEHKCGRIKSRHFGSLAGVRNPTKTYILVVNYKVDIEDKGDSGGPWYDGHTALGIHVAGDRRDKAAYMSITYLNDDGPIDFNLKVVKADARCPTSC